MVLQTAPATVAPASSRVSARLLPCVLAALLGLVLIYGVGLAPQAAVHAAAHDVRHAAGFPCH